MTDSSRLFGTWPFLSPSDCIHACRFWFDHSFEALQSPKSALGKAISGESLLVALTADAAKIGVDTSDLKAFSSLLPTYERPAGGTVDTGVPGTAIYHWIRSTPCIFAAWSWAAERSHKSGPVFVRSPAHPAACPHPGLDQVSWCILKHLSASPCLCTIDDLTRVVPRSVGPIRVAVARLIKDGLIERPHPRKGAGITSRGRAFVAPLLSVQTSG